MKKNQFNGLLFCNGGYSSSLLANKLTKLGQPYNLVFQENGLGSTKMSEVVEHYDVVLFAPHLRANYDDYEELFEDENIPFLQVEGKEYLATGPGVNALFDRILTALELK